MTTGDPRDQYTGNQAADPWSQSASFGQGSATQPSEDPWAQAAAGGPSQQGGYEQSGYAQSSHGQGGYGQSAWGQSGQPQGGYGQLPGGSAQSGSMPSAADWGSVGGPVQAGWSPSQAPAQYTAYGTGASDPYSAQQSSHGPAQDPYAAAWGQHPYVEPAYGGYAMAPGYAGQPRPSVGMMQAVKLLFKNGLTFSGRASQSEYWWVVLFNGVIYLVAALVGGFMSAAGDAGSVLGTVVLVLMWVYMLVALIPGIALVVRRLHDTNKSGWLLLLSFVPFGSLILLVLMAMGSDPMGVHYDNPDGSQPAVD